MKRILALIILLLMIGFMIMPILITNDESKQIKEQEDNTYIVEITESSKMLIVTSEPVIEKISEQNQIENITQEMQTKMAEIETIENKQEYFLAYKNIVSEYSEWFDAPETIYNYYTSEELDLLFRVVQAEIGNYSFEQKCNVVSVIFNRLNNERFPNTMSEILVANQFCTIRNGSIHKVTVDETTILACEYVFMFGDTTGGALFFDSNGALNYKFVFNDGAHNFYKLKGE